MIAWLNAAALWGLAATLGAVLVHLLFRRRATRVLFPSLRFVNPSLASAMRPRRPTDAALLAVRIAILGAAAVAFARPLLITPSRARAWNGRVARAIVVDTSASMAGAAVADAVRAETAGAVSSTQIDTPEVPRGLTDAVRWLSSAPPARREVVVFSDLQRGVLRDADIAHVPDGVGLRFVTAGSLPREREVAGVPVLTAGGQETARRVRVSRETTSVASDATTGVAEGLEIVAPDGSDEAVRALNDIVSAAGTPAPSPSEPILVALGGRDGALGDLRAPSRAWMVRAVERLRADEDLRPLGDVPDSGTASPWVVVLQDAAGTPLVRAAASGERLVIDIAAAPRDFLAAAAVRGALVARGSTASLAESEVLPVGPAALARWTRPAGPISAKDAAVWRNAQSDARWVWVLALVLLGAESVLRRERKRASEVRADAA